MKIRSQLAILAVSSITLVLIIGLLSLHGKRAVDEALDANTVLATVLRHHGEADMMHDALRGDVYEAVLAGLASDADHLKETQKEFAAHAANFTGRIEEIAKINVDDVTRSQIEKLRGPLEAYISVAKDVIGGAGDAEATKSKLKGFQTTFESLEKPMSALSDHLEEQVRIRKEKVDQATSLAEKIAVSSALVGTVLIAFLAFVMSRSVTNAIEDLKQAIGDVISTNDLTRRLPARKDEFSSLGAALNQFFSSLHDSVARVREGAEHIGSSSQQVEQGHRSLSARAETHAANLEETASSMEELTSAVKRNTDSAQHANELADGASKVAERGGNTVRSVVTTMNDISEASRKIADIVNVIDGIAFQTNILSLNAAVEAARAGEQGRGFAVVSGEVRALAQRSAQAAREIRDMIQSSAEKVDNGTRFVGEAGKTMEDIVNAVKEVRSLISEISGASREQLAGIEQINRAITDMDAATQQNAAMVEQSTAAAEQMSEQARNLVAAVARFKLETKSDAVHAIPAATISRVAKPASSPAATTGYREPALPRGGRHAALSPALATNAASKSNDGWTEF